LLSCKNSQNIISYHFGVSLSQNNSLGISINPLFQCSILQRKTSRDIISGYGHQTSIQTNFSVPMETLFSKEGTVYSRNLDFFHIRLFVRSSKNLDFNLAFLKLNDFNIKKIRGCSEISRLSPEISFHIKNKLSFVLKFVEFIFARILLFCGEINISRVETTQRFEI